MKKLNLLIITSIIVTAPLFITGCDDKKDEVGRDKNVPNNVEDNYTRDNDDPNRAKTEPPRDKK